MKAPWLKFCADLGATHLTQNGYVMIKVLNEFERGTWRQQHRVVMEEHLGRPLLTDEVVHHKNGVRTDNRIENLELWVKSQPPGQRVVDRLTDAIRTVERYGDMFGYEVVRVKGHG